MIVHSVNTDIFVLCLGPTLGGSAPWRGARDR